MLSNLDTAPLFDQERWSDITIKFGDRGKKCHKAILCSRSAYFVRLLSEDGSFKESSGKVVELKEDDPDAVDAMLHYVYTFSYEVKAHGRSPDWNLHLNVAVVAHKYAFTDLEMTAFEQFKSLAMNPVHIREVIEILRVLPDQDYSSNNLEEFEYDLLGEHFSKLIQEPEYRAALERGGKLAVRYLKRVGFAFNLVATEIEECETCGHRQQPGCGDAPKGVYQTHQNPALYASREGMMSMRCWIRQEDII